jgi:hypothetical protein
VPAVAVRSSIRSRSRSPPKSAFTGYRFASQAIVIAVRWCLRFNVSYRDIQELLVERGIEVDHVTGFRWVRRFILRTEKTAQIIITGHAFLQNPRRGHYELAIDTPPT